MLSELRARVRRDLLDFAWRQWAQMGLSANLSGSDNWAVDPEAQILFTLEVARRDPRLFDELLDWLALNRELLNVQRLRNLAFRFPVDPALAGAALAWAGEPVSPSRWPRRKASQDRRTNGDLVFSPDVLGFIGDQDPAFAAYGYERPAARRSGKSSAPDVRLPVNLAFRLRHLFGSGSRSEVMRILLTFPDGPTDAARISDEAGFAKRNIRDTLAGLVTSGVVQARWEGNERLYRADRDTWATILGESSPAHGMPCFVSWVHLLPACLEVASWLEDEVESADSDYLISSRARDLIERLESDLEMARITPGRDRSLPGAAFLTGFVDTVESILGKIRAEK